MNGGKIMEIGIIVEIFENLMIDYIKKLFGVVLLLL